MNDERKWFEEWLDGVCDDFIKSMKWSESSTEWEKSLAIGNVRGFKNLVLIRWQAHAAQEPRPSGELRGSPCKQCGQPSGHWSHWKALYISGAFGPPVKEIEDNAFHVFVASSEAAPDAIETCKKIMWCGFVETALPILFTYVNRITVIKEREIAELKQASGNLLDYIEEHDWGNIPEPYDSINPLLRLLGRDENRQEEVCQCGVSLKQHTTSEEGHPFIPASEREKGL